MGSSGKVVNLVVGKEVTTIGSQFQKSYIGTPTAKLSLTLEEGSKLSSVGNDAFKDNSFFVSIDLSNAGNVTFGTSAFNNVSNLTHFSTNKGTLTLNTLAMGNLKKLQVLDWNASSTTLNWQTSLTTTATFTSKATTSATTTNSDTKTSSTTGAATITWGTGSISNVGYYPTGQGTAGASTAAASTFTGDFTNTSTASTTVTATYAWTGTDNTGNHPLYNLGASVSAGTTVNLNETVVSIPNYTFTTGIYAFETKTGTLTRNYTATGSSNFTITKTTTGTASVPAIQRNSAAIYFYIRNANYGGQAQQQIKLTSIGATSHSITRSGKLTVTTTVTQTCSISEGVKTSKATGIKVGRVNSFSKKLTSIGQSAFGWIQIPITSANNDLPSASVTSTFTATPTATATRTSTTAATLNAAKGTAGHQYYSVWVNRNNGSYWVANYWSAWTGTGYNNLSTYITAVSAATYGGASGNYLNTVAIAQGVMTNLIGSQITCTANDSIATTVKSGTITIPASKTTTKVWSVDNTKATASAGTVPAGNALTIANFGIAGPNMTINSGAFIGAKSLSQVYLAGTVENIQAIVFNTRNTASTDKIYVYGKSAASEFTTSTGLTANNDLGIEYRKDAKDLGRYINHYQIGTSVYAYLFETDPDKYLINIVGTGATYTNYTASNRPGWAASYANKVTQLIVDDTVTSVGPYLFYGHTALTTVQFGSGLTSIGAHAFGNCTGLDSFTVPATLTSVGERILEGASVKKVYYNANTSDAYHSMSGCAAEEIILGANVTTIGDGTLGDISGKFFVASGNTHLFVNEYGHLLSRNPDTGVVSLLTYAKDATDEAFTLDGVNTVNAGAFYGANAALKSVSFGNSVTAIGNNAFGTGKTPLTIYVYDFQTMDNLQSHVSPLGTKWSGTDDHSNVQFVSQKWDIGNQASLSSIKQFSFVEAGVASEVKRDLLIR